MKTVKIDFNNPYEKEEVTDEFKEKWLDIEPLDTNNNLKTIKEIAESGNKINQAQTIKHQKFVDAGLVEGNNLKLEKDVR